jgi:hypothetical protein
MTRLVNGILEKALPEMEEEESKKASLPSKMPAG